MPLNWHYISDIIALQHFGVVCVIMLNTPQVTFIFLLYTWAFSEVCIRRKYKWQVGYSMIDNMKVLHNYFMLCRRIYGTQYNQCDIQLMMGRLVTISIQRLSRILICCLFYDMVLTVILYLIALLMVLYQWCKCLFICYYYREIISWDTELSEFMEGQEVITFNLERLFLL